MAFENLKIHAIITNSEGHAIVSESGDYPNTQFHPDHKTIEGAVHALGRMLGIAALSVAMREPNKDSDIVYRTKPIQSDIALPPGYNWRTTHEPASEAEA